MKPMTTLQDLIEEAKLRTVWWAICIFAITYFLSHTSKSMWTNLPLAILILAALRYLSYEVEFHWRNPQVPKPTYLSRLGKKQLSRNDSRLSTAMLSLQWRRKIDSPSVETAIEEFIDKILKDFVVDLWYSSITPDKEAPELIRNLILDVIAEISVRVKDVNLVDLLTRDLVDLIRSQLELYRKSQSEIGVKVMGTLSFEERDERLKRHLMAAKELHPALFSLESEYKVLQRMVGGILAVSLKPREAQCPLVRCISRELLTCLVMQPLMNFASPAYINELIEVLSQRYKDSSDIPTEFNGPPASSSGNSHFADSVESKDGQRALKSTKLVVVSDDSGKKILDFNDQNHSKTYKDTMHYAPTKPTEWATILDAATKRRSQVLAPENLESMWTKGRNYQKKTAKLIEAGTLPELSKVRSATYAGGEGKELVTNMSDSIRSLDEKYLINLMHGSKHNEQKIYPDISKDKNGGSHEAENHMNVEDSETSQLKRSTSIPDMRRNKLTESLENSLKEKTSSSPIRRVNNANELILHSEGSLHVPKLKCRVVGAYFEKIGAKSFAVYSIAVTDAENKAWFVKRRYRNFERLHRQLKDIPNYSLHLPPKRFLSSSIDDYFVHQRCILLDKYLQDLLSMANIAEQHEVWDFLSDSSKNYSFGKSTSVMKTLAVNVDDAMDDIVRQFKDVSGGLLRKVSPSHSHDLTSTLMAERNMSLSWNEEELHKKLPSFGNVKTSHSFSDDESHFGEQSTSVENGWHSDNELNSRNFRPRVVKYIEGSRSLGYTEDVQSDKSNRFSFEGSKTSLHSYSFEDPVGMPPEWTPPNVSVPLLNLVDNVFQLNQRGWLRRQVFWISKQILQLMMEDAIDDWILRQIHLLRRDDIIAKGIRWIQDILWPQGTFFMKLEVASGKSDDRKISQRPSQITKQSNGDKRPSSFELQLEAARRASDVKKMILGGAPSALVSLIGPNQYKRCAKDVYYFIQSNVCVKQLAYGILETVLVAIFPELRDVILDIHESSYKHNL